MYGIWYFFCCFLLYENSFPEEGIAKSSFLNFTKCVLFSVYSFFCFLHFLFTCSFGRCVYMKKKYMRFSGPVLLYHFYLGPLLAFISIVLYCSILIPFLAVSPQCRTLTWERALDSQYRGFTEFTIIQLPLIHLLLNLE